MRLTPLGWTCIDTPGQNDGTMLQTNFSSTVLIKDMSSLDKLNTDLKRFLEIKEEPTIHETPVIRLEENNLTNKQKAL